LYNSAAKDYREIRLSGRDRFSRRLCGAAVAAVITLHRRPEDHKGSLAQSEELHAYGVVFGDCE